ncbi:MAG: alcohol dehydrogenase family protein [Pseudomonadota bacterium]
MDRFDTSNATDTMFAVVTTGNGDFDKLEYRKVPKPQLRTGEVLLRVLAAGVNNTEINTRLGWYSSSVTDSTDQMAERQAITAEHKSDGGWNEATPFPLIQGTDCCGRVMELGEGATGLEIEDRVLVRACMRPEGYKSMENVWMGSDFDGAFAEYVRVPAQEVFPVRSNWSDEELATLPCAYGTAENMLHRAKLEADEDVLITGASGGVGSAAVQLARRRGARITAIAGASKIAQVQELGAQDAVARGEDLIGALGENSVDLVVDNVGGENFPKLLRLLRRGGRYVSSGAIAGPFVSLDMREMYLKDIRLIGTTAWDEPVFPNLISYVEKNEIRPLLAGVFPLSEIAAAQREFLAKTHVGKMVLVP